MRRWPIKTTQAKCLASAGLVTLHSVSSVKPSKTQDVDPMLG